MMLIDDIKQRLKQYFSDLETISDTSKNDGDTIRVSNSTIKVINGDKFQEEYYNKLVLKLNTVKVNPPKSVDALYIDENNEIYFIEFKIGKNIKSDELKLKSIETLLSFMDICKVDIDFARKYITYIVAYKITSSFSKIQEGATENSSMPLKDFGLNRLKGIYFKEVMTFTSDKFEEHIKKHNWQDIKI